MHFLYCNVGWMESYNGNQTERPVGGGAYNRDNIGHEVNNFTNVDGTYYGYVSAETIDISKHFLANQGETFVEGITVVWFSQHLIVGYYRNARVYRKIQYLPEKMNRVYRDYNITSTYAQLIPSWDRRFVIGGNGQSNIWYGNPQIDDKVLAYIEDYDERLKADTILDFTRPLEGYEKEALIKARVNQDKFRKRMLNKYGRRCCLCGVQMPDLLIASHIKPWSRCDNNEKVSDFNGLLLCPNHDHLFDKGFISFDDDGRILISEKLTQTDRVFMNIRPDMRISVEGDMKPFLKYHRANVFRG